jgi:hypothetical protein
VTSLTVPMVARLRLPDGREVAVHTDTEPDSNPDIGDPAAPYGGTVFYWTEGNCGCDCNRMLYIEREHGVALLPRAADYRCGDTITLIGLWVDGRQVR